MADVFIRHMCGSLSQLSYKLSGKGLEICSIDGAFAFANYFGSCTHFIGFFG